MPPQIDHDSARRFSWAIANVAMYLEELRYFRAKTLSISGPQLTILMAVIDLEEGQGVSVRVVAKAIHVDPSFITTQTKLLEKKGLVRRRTDDTDARVVKLSLTDKAYKQIASTAGEEEALNEFIFADLTTQKLDEVTQRLNALKIRLEKACLKVEGGF
ncbi:MarR family transcriptional regulator [Rhodopseudomonas palustris]|uniref:MarR family transcriptional regulator n=2 Tax=Nitrobacteraceae TaxID=41294 RepID=A0A0D7E6V9_RHOPL|nr:MarR family transcriptional regulator [Rhodopseudomonas palustris]